MVVNGDPMYRLPVALPSKSLWRRVLSLLRRGNRDEVIGSMLLLCALFGLRQAHRVQQFTASIQGSSWAMLERLAGSYSHAVAGIRDTVTGVKQKAESTDLEHSSSDQESTVVDRVGRFTAKHLDTALISLLSYKCLVVLVYTMPSEYFFGLKTSFLKWASRAEFFRGYLKVVPFLTVSLVAAATSVVRSSQQPMLPSLLQRWQALAFLNMVLTYCTTRLFEFIRGDPSHLLQLEATAQERDILSVEPPPLSLLRAATWAQRQVTPPVFLGLSVLPQERRKMLFVGNHMIWGMDVGLFTHGAYEHGIWVRPLGEHAWFSLPGLGEFMRYIGVIDGNKHNCDLLMQRGDNLLVYPGGARESWKRTTDPKYSIHWSDHHVGFAVMAITHGYTIVPVATVGIEDVFELVVDLPISKVLTGGGLLPTPKKGTSKAFDSDAKLPLIVPRPGAAQRVYFKFLDPIYTDKVQGQQSDLELVKKIRNEARTRLEAGIEELKEYRKTDKDRFVFKTGSPQSRL